MKTLLILLMPLSIFATDVIDFIHMPFWNRENPEPVRKFVAEGREVYVGKFRDGKNLCYVILSETGAGLSCLPGDKQEQCNSSPCHYKNSY